MHARPIEQHPDTGKRLRDLVVPHWHTLLTLSVQWVDTSGLGYMEADFVLDKERGPLLLELNARPGLAIQVANGKVWSHVCNVLKSKRIYIHSEVQRSASTTSLR